MQAPLLHCDSWPKDGIIAQIQQELKQFQGVSFNSSHLLYRSPLAKIGDLLVPSPNNGRVKLQKIASIPNVAGPAFLYRKNNPRFIAVKFSVRGRDPGSTIADTQQQVGARIRLPQGYSTRWNGEPESQARAQHQLTLTVPISILAIFFLWFVSFGNVLDSVLVLLKVSVTLIGGTAALLLTGVNFLILAGVGFSALVGLATQDGAIPANKSRRNMREGTPLVAAIHAGTKSRLRPLASTAPMALLGLLPAAFSTGIGSKTQKPPAVVVIDAPIIAALLSPLSLPAVCEWVYSSR